MNPKLLVELARYARAHAQNRGRDVLKDIQTCLTEPDSQRAHILANVFMVDRAHEAFSWANYALDIATELGWYPTNNSKSDWFLM